MTSTDGRCVASIRWMPGRARLLRDARDELLDLLAGDHHQVGELVDDDDDQRQLLQRLGRVRRERERIGQRLARLLRLGDLLVEAGEVAHAELRTSACSGAPSRRRTSCSALAACFMSVTTGASRCGMPSYTDSSSILGSTRIRRTSRGSALYSSDRIIALTATDLPEPVVPGDQQMRHAREIGDDRLAGDVLAQRQGQRPAESVYAVEVRISTSAPPAASGWEARAPCTTCRESSRRRECSPPTTHAPDPSPD